MSNIMIDFPSFHIKTAIATNIELSRFSNPSDIAHF